MKAIIKTELDLAITYSRIALESDNNEKIAKHREKARKTYDAALQFLVTAVLTQNEAIEITKKLSSLKADLLELGEEF